MKPGKILRGHQLPEDLASQQHYIDRAEEDLLCAVYLYWRGICGVVPYVVVCFLLHQATEKWLKAFLAVAGLEFPPRRQSHELRFLFDQAAKKETEFQAVKDEVDEEILGQNFPGDLRYNATRESIEDCIGTLWQAAFRTRRLVKGWLKRREA